MRNALKKIQEVNREYASISGRSYGNGLIDEYKLNDAEIAVVCIGSTAGTLKVIVDQLSKKESKQASCDFEPLGLCLLKNSEMR